MTAYETALANSFLRIYAKMRTLELEARHIADKYPSEARADINRGLFGYRYEVYANIRDILGASHKQAITCVLGKIPPGTN